MLRTNERNPVSTGGEQFQSILEAIPAPLACVDQDYTYLFANEAYARWFGRDRDDIVGRTIPEIAGEAAWINLRLCFSKALAGESQQVEELVYGKSGNPVWMAATYTPYLDQNKTLRGAIVLMRDISDRKKAESGLRKEHELNSLLLTTTAALIVVLDNAGKIVHFNRAFESVTKYPFNEVVGRPFFELFLYPDEAGHVQVLFERLQDGRSISKHVNFIRTREGTPRLIEWSSSVLFLENGQLEYVIGTGLDITDRQELEQELLAISDLERERIGQELHDGLGQRLTALELFAYALKEEVRQHAPFLIDQCEQMSRELRETARQARTLSHGLAPVFFARDGLKLALEDLAQNTTSMAKIDCSFRCDGQSVAADIKVGMHLYRIAQEAVNNALRHAHPTKITINCSAVEGECELTVHDNGIGFVPNQAASGMGLKLIRHRAELIGATIRIDSSADQGTTVQCRVRGMG
ncbi:MAG TPA: PAS domain S-box protein [Verrucomicrobiae bacterium]|jgi:PAS domain S-box-containing protein|nr:PAS domain S-box protein [Verrucomicrobiae bacterium]